MKSEYVKLSIPERMYGKKNFYHVQLSLLNLMKSLKDYKNIRTEEMTLKIALKTKISELQEQIGKFEKMLPAVPLKERTTIEKQERQERKNLSLEEEIEAIKHKISRLQLGI